MPKMLPDLMTIEDVADYLRVSVRTVQRMIKDGRLHAISLGRTWRIPITALEDLVALNDPKQEEEAAQDERTPDGSGPDS